MYETTNETELCLLDLEEAVLTEDVVINLLCEHRTHVALAFLPEVRRRGRGRGVRLGVEAKGLPVGSIPRGLLDHMDGMTGRNQHRHEVASPTA